eukprot:6938699-Pyramimonas_sp.AAC.1
MSNPSVRIGTLRMFRKTRAMSNSPRPSGPRVKASDAARNLLHKYQHACTWRPCPLWPQCR